MSSAQQSISRRQGREAARLEGGPESGFSLVEMMVAMVIFAIAMAMTGLVASNVISLTASQGHQATATGSNQASIVNLVHLVNGTISPLGFYEAEDQNPLYPIATTSDVPCWGESNPSSIVPWVSGSMQTPALNVTSGYQLGGATFGQTPVNLSGVLDPETLSIIYAHDFDMEWCAIPPGTSSNGIPNAPHVYEALIKPGSCLNPTYGYCTFEVVDYTATNASVAGSGFTPANGFGATTIGAGAAGVNFPYDSAPSSSSAEYSSPCSGTCTGYAGDVVMSIPDVWCDVACQSASLNSNGGYSGPTWACSSMEAASLASDLPVALTTPFSTDCPSYTASLYTPPIFSYESTKDGSLNTPATPLDLVCSTSPCNSAAQDVDVLNLYDTQFGSVTIDLTVLANTNPALAAPGGKPGTTLTQNVLLSNAIASSS